MKRTALAPFLLVVAANALPGCITDPVTGQSTLGMPISDAEEAEMGLQYRPAITQEYSGPYPDPALQAHLEPIVLGMSKRSVRPNLPWTFTILNSSVPNAFAVPGGQVFVTRGILVRMTDEAEFAVVMGHEIGHVEHRHSVQAMGRQQVFGGLATAVAIGAGEEFGNLAGTGLGLWELGFSRDQERESDVRGIENSYAAGYDPREGADVFRTFLAMKQEMGDDTPWFLSTHPADEERIQSILTLSAQKDPRFGGSAPVEGFRKTTPTWGSLTAKLKQDQKTYDVFDAALAEVGKSKGSRESVQRAIPALERCARELPGHALLHAMLGKAKVIAGDTAGGRAALERASSMNQGLFEPEWILGALALEDRRWEPAGAYAERGLKALPGNYLCLAVRGEALWNLGRKSDAQRDFEQVMKAAPQDSEEYRLAATRLGVQTAPAEGTDPSKPLRRKRKK